MSSVRKSKENLEMGFWCVMNLATFNDYVEYCDLQRHYFCYHGH